MDFNSSDSNITMAAATVFDSIIRQIQASNLNFKLSLSPFAANISIKKTPVKNRSGIPFPPRDILLAAGNTTKEVEELISKNVKLEEDLVNMKCKYDGTVNDLEITQDHLKQLQKYQPSGAGGTRSPPATPHRPQS